MMTGIWFLGMLLSPGFLPDTPAPKELELQAKVIEAMEGGPFVIQTKLTNQSKSPIKIEVDRWFQNNSSLIIRENWEVRIHVFKYLLLGREPERKWKTLQPGESISESLYAHHSFFDLPSKKIKVELLWHVGEATDRNGQPVADPKLVLDVDIKPATARNLAALVSRLEQRLNGLNSSRQEKEQLVQTLLYTKHDVLLPIAMDLLKKGFFQYSELGVFLENHSANAEARRQLIDILEDMNWFHREIIFNHWRNQKTVVNETELKKLISSRDIWMRVLAYRFFGAQYDPSAIKTLFADLRQHTAEFPAKQFARLLTELDDDDFEIRQRASNKLLEVNFQVEGKLRRLKKTDLSPEVAQRVQEVLSSCEAENRDELPAARVLRFLSSKVPREHALLSCLAEGDPDSWLTQKAKKKLDPARNPED